MDVTCSFSFSVRRVSDPHVRNILWVLGSTLAATVVIFASLASIQNQCRFEDPDLLSGISGFSGTVLGCKKLYRYYWFITVLNFVTAVYGTWLTARGFLARSRGAVLGLLVIANLLTINMTDAFISIVDIPKWQNGPAHDRSRTMIAGCIMTAFFQALSIVLVGWQPNAVTPVQESPSVCRETPKTEETIVELASQAAPIPEILAAAEPEPAPAAADVEAPVALTEEAPAALPSGAVAV